MAELAKQSQWSSTKPRLYHLRTQNGQEVDIVLEDSRGRCVGIEVKAGASPSAADFAGLRAMEEILKKRFVRGLVLYAGAETIAFGHNLHAAPVSALWSLGASPAPKARTD